VIRAVWRDGLTRLEAQAPAVELDRDQVRLES
jgi:hypothetical protein